MKPPRLRPVVPPRAKSPWRQASGRRSHREGHGAEWTAALWLMLKGYRILGFRLKTHAGEIDLLARRGNILAVVEVKRRATIQAALLALDPRQFERLLSAGAAVTRHRPALQRLELRIDMVALAPRRFPRHVRAVERERSGGLRTS